MDTIIRPRRDFAWLEKRRMKAAALFEEGKSQADVARILKVSRQSVPPKAGYGSWKSQGEQGLKGAGRAGRKPKLSPPELKRLEQSLLRGPSVYGYATELWTLERIVSVIEKIFHVHYHPGHVWRILRELGWSCQRPQRQARERNEIAIQRWVRYKWPRIKKKPKS